LIFKQWNAVTWTEYIWLRIRIGDGRL
jgi:hypothetical protein